MSYRTPPQPTVERACETQRLIDKKATDIARWAQFANLATEWDGRAVQAGKQVASGSRVLDVGAGAMTLERHLPEGCSYFPADVVARRPGCQVVDLNAAQFPQGRYDYVTFLGVLEYVHDVITVLQRAATAAPNMIVTYCTLTDGDPVRRRGMGWVNDFTDEQFQRHLASANWQIRDRIEVKRGNGNLQLMYVCSRVEVA